MVHEIDPRQRDQFAVPTNPSGVLPMWVDADTSCVWGASTVMRFVCDKHHLSPGAYAEEDFHRKTKTNMAIDWCANVLKPHIHRLVYPEQYDQTSSSSVENTKPVLHRDMKVRAAPEPSPTPPPPPPSHTRPPPPPPTRDPPPR